MSMRRRRQRLQRAVGLPVELHEHVVPDLDVAVAVALQAAAAAAGRLVGAGQVRARGSSRSPSSGRTGRCRPSARSCRPRRARRSASAGSERPPDLVRLVVARHAGLALEHRGEQPVLRQLPFVGQQRPGERDRVALEVVAEREVAEHLEERVVAERRPDVVEVVVLAADAHALLRRRRARVVARLPAEEHVLELVHPGVGEEQRRVVVRHERRAGHDAVAVPLEVLEEGRADLVRGHLAYCTSGLGRLTRRGRARRRALQRARDELRLEALSRPGTDTAARPSRSSIGPRSRPRRPRSSAAATSAVGVDVLERLRDGALRRRRRRCRRPRLPGARAAGRAASDADLRSARWRRPSRRVVEGAVRLAGGRRRRRCRRRIVARRVRRWRTCASDSSRRASSAQAVPGRRSAKARDLWPAQCSRRQPSDRARARRSWRCPAPSA